MGGTIDHAGGAGGCTGGGGSTTVGIMGTVKLQVVLHMLYLFML